MTIAGAWARRAMTSAMVAACLASAGSARAEGSRPDWAFGQPGAEVGVASFVAAANLTYFLPQRAGDWGPSSRLGADATAADWSNLFASVGGALIATGTGYVLEAGYLASVGSETPGTEALYATMVESESLLFTNAITMTLKKLVGRCRPRAFEGTGCSEHDAFPSGHTSSIASFAGARVYRLARTDASDAGFGLRAGALGLAEASTIAAGALRIAAGAHSWEDVVVGALVGHATGVLVAALHPEIAVERRPDEAGAAAATTTGPAPASAREQRVMFSWGTAF